MINKKLVIIVIILSCFCIEPLLARVNVSRSNTGQAHGKVTAGGVIITQIISNPAWPGQRPPGKEHRLHYNTTHVSDDQIIIDVVLHAPGSTASALTGTIENFFHEIVVVPEQGNLDNATPEDRMYLALAMIRRAGNYPQANFDKLTEQQLLQYSDPDTDTNSMYSNYRLFNWFAVTAHLDSHDVPSNIDTLHQVAQVGPTPFRLFRPVHIVVQDGTLGPQHTFVFTPADMNGVVNVPNNIGDITAVLYGNDKVVNLPPGWSNGSGGARIGHRNATRIGPLLIAFEEYLMNEDGPEDQRFGVGPFWNEIIFDMENRKYKRTALNCNMQAQIDPSYNYLATGGTWPTHTIYWLNIKKNEYKLIENRPQIISPFHGFIKLPPGVRPPVL